MLLQCGGRNVKDAGECCRSKMEPSRSGEEVVGAEKERRSERKGSARSVEVGVGFFVPRAGNNVRVFLCAEEGHECSGDDTLTS
ncbi:hypothetical protein VNO80_10039 [Phaseolus coccineus]|uniref:Uncharacterized protein n=1 Tax=Phaseolus coccineus TaxID=3886 RepID=A0AAN9NCP6_PHACN